MPIWHDNMTADDHKRNIEEMRIGCLRRARELRRQAAQMLREADEIERRNARQGDMIDIHGII